MKNTTLCYIEKDEKYLMLHRTKKENDHNKDKWLGVGGKFEEKESPEECAIREIYEETGLITDEYCYRGIVTFVSNQYETEIMHLFTVPKFHGDVIECNEGDLEWVAKTDVFNLHAWEGDKIFLNLIFCDAPFFSLKLEYDNDKLILAVLNGKKFDI